MAAEKTPLEWRPYLPSTAFMSQQLRVLHLLGIEAWQLRSTQAQVRHDVGSARTTDASHRTELKPPNMPAQSDQLTAFPRHEVAAPAARRVVASTDSAQRRDESGRKAPISSAGADPRNSLATGAQIWRLQLALSSTRNVLVLRPNAATAVGAARFVRDVAAALSGVSEPPTLLERFDWPPAGNLELAHREPCRAALLAMLARRWQSQEFRIALIVDQEVSALLGEETSATQFALQRDGAMQFLHVPHPALIAAQPAQKRELWSVIQRWRAS